MSAQQTADVLGRTDVFGQCEPEVLSWVAERVHTRSYRRHETVVREGELGDSLFVVATGAVKLQLTSREGDVVVLTTLRPYDTFGELAVLDGGPRSASAEALQDSTLLAVPREVLLGLLNRQPTVADALLKVLGSTLRRLTEQMADTAFLDLPGRVAKLLLTLADQHQPPQPGPAAPRVVELTLTQTELAHMVGGTRQSVNRILAGFEARGLVHMDGRTIVIRRPDQLARRAAT